MSTTNTQEQQQQQQPDASSSPKRRCVEDSATGEQVAILVVDTDEQVATSADMSTTTTTAVVDEPKRKVPFILQKNKKKVVWCKKFASDWYPVERSFADRPFRVLAIVVVEDMDFTQIVVSFRNELLARRFHTFLAETAKHADITPAGFLILDAMLNRELKKRMAAVTDEDVDMYSQALRHLRELVAKNIMELGIVQHDDLGSTGVLNSNYCLTWEAAKTRGAADATWICFQ